MLKAFRLKVDLLSTTLFSSISLLFLTIAPGVLGGDIVRAFYLMRRGFKQDRLEILNSIFIDRVFGIIAPLSVPLFLFFAQDLPFSQLPLLTLIGIIFATFSCLSLILWIQISLKPMPWLTSVLNFSYRLILIGPILKNILPIFKNLKYLLASFMAAAVHGLLTAAIYLLFAREISEHTANLFQFSQIIPLGSIVLAIPISPGGLGIGHVAFENLFKMIGQGDGANIFNVVVLSFMAVNLLGAIPYLLYKGQKSQSEKVLSTSNA